MITIYEVLVDPTRRQILDLLREKPRMVGQLVDLLETSQPLMSKHLRVLRDVGLVHVRQEAQRRWYELHPQPLAEIDVWLQPYRQLMEARYERLDALLLDLQEQEKEMNDDQGQTDR
jgi:DNA-binding transcriptional ArsR family regulator